jgi:hypothetical protein
MKLYRFGFWTLITAAFAMGTVTPLVAAQGDVYAQAGVVSIGDGGGTHALAGGGVSGMIGSHAAIFGEFNYTPTGDYGESTSGFGISSRIIRGGAGLRVYVPAGNKMMRLYVPVAGGMLKWSVTGTGSGFSASVSANGGYFGTGFGAEIGHKFGIRPEFLYSRYQISFAGASGSSNVVSVGASVFYRFGGE